MDEWEQLLYLPSLRGEFTACTYFGVLCIRLYLPSLRGEFTARLPMDEWEQLLYLPSLRGEFTAETDYPETA